MSCQLPQGFSPGLPGPCRAGAQGATGPTTPAQDVDDLVRELMKRLQSPNAASCSGSPCQGTATGCETDPEASKLEKKLAELLKTLGTMNRQQAAQPPSRQFA